MNKSRFFLCNALIADIYRIWDRIEMGQILDYIEIGLRVNKKIAADS